MGKFLYGKLMSNMVSTLRRRMEDKIKNFALNEL